MKKELFGEKGDFDPLLSQLKNFANERYIRLDKGTHDDLLGEEDFGRNEIIFCKVGENFSRSLGESFSDNKKE